MGSENLHVHKPNRLQSLYIFLLFIPSIVFVVVLTLYLSAIHKNRAASTYQPIDVPAPKAQETFSNSVTVSDIPIKVALADTNEKRARGLSVFQSLPPDRGMLFVFPENSRPHFWMKNMSFAIDIIWINDGQIVQIDENALPPEPDTTESELKLFTPTEEIDYVLEVNAGFSQEHGLVVGDSFTF